MIFSEDSYHSNFQTRDIIEMGNQCCKPGTNSAEKPKPKKSFSETYILGEILGEGAFSVVKLATHRETGQKVAVKIIHKSGLSEEDELSLKQVSLLDLGSF